MRKTWHGANHPSNTVTRLPRRGRLARVSPGALALLAGALVGGIAIGVGTSSPVESQVQQLTSRATPAPLADLHGRARKPQLGDYWPRCAYAKAAGSAPIYAGEPGYRRKLDADHDGIACEPFFGD